MPNAALYIQILAGLGAIILMTAWVPMIMRKMPLSLPIFCVGAGAALFMLPALHPFAVHPLQHPIAVERLSELVVVVSLMGAGLKIDRLIGLHRWALTWRLLAIAMPITILLVAALASSLLGLGIAAAVLIGSSLAPTDPVLASDVQVGAPGEGEEGEARFAAGARVEEGGTDPSAPGQRAQADIEQGHERQPRGDAEGKAGDHRRLEQVGRTPIHQGPAGGMAPQPAVESGGGGITGGGGGGGSCLKSAPPRRPPKVEKTAPRTACRSRPRTKLTTENLPASSCAFSIMSILSKRSLAASLIFVCLSISAPIAPLAACSRSLKPSSAKQLVASAGTSVQGSAGACVAWADALRVVPIADRTTRAAAAIRWFEVMTVGLIV